MGLGFIFSWCTGVQGRAQVLYLVGVHVFKGGHRFYIELVLKCSRVGLGFIFSWCTGVQGRAQVLY